jgi:uncharacterized membrane protein
MRYRAYRRRRHSRAATFNLRYTLAGGARVARQFALLNPMRNTDIFFVEGLSTTAASNQKKYLKILSTATFNDKVVLAIHNEQVVCTNHQG